MKTTNLEISKKLKEIGFNAETDKCWAKIRNSKLDEFSIRTLDFSIPANCDEWYPSYDLETLINALPQFINNGQEELVVGKNYIGYFEEESIICSQINAVCEKSENESLADTAGRLLIKLHEVGIINFKK